MLALVRVLRKQNYFFLSKIFQKSYKKISPPPDRVSCNTFQELHRKFSQGNYTNHASRRALISNRANDNHSLILIVLSV